MPCLRLRGSLRLEFTNLFILFWDISKLLSSMADAESLSQFRWPDAVFLLRALQLPVFSQTSSPRCVCHRLLCLLWSPVEFQKVLMTWMTCFSTISSKAPNVTSHTEWMLNGHLLNSTCFCCHWLVQHSGANKNTSWNMLWSSSHSQEKYPNLAIS